jgi:hypothetical protein
MNGRQVSPIAIAGIVLCWVVSAGCAQTKRTSSWRDPQFRGTVHKVLVVGVTTDQSRRRMFEDAMASAFAEHGVQAVSGYGALPQDVGQPTKEQLRAAVQQTGVDAVLLVRVVSNETRTQVDNATPPPPVSYDDYYDWSWQTTSVGPEIYQYQVVKIQADLFDTGSGKMVWTGRTETIDPKDVPKEIKKFAGVVTGDMAKKKLLPK